MPLEFASCVSNSLVKLRPSLLETLPDRDFERGCPPPSPPSPPPRPPSPPPTPRVEYLPGFFGPRNLRDTGDSISSGSGNFIARNGRSYFVPATCDLHPMGVDDAEDKRFLFRGDTAGSILRFWNQFLMVQIIYAFVNSVDFVL